MDIFVDIFVTYFPSVQFYANSLETEHISLMSKLGKIKS